MDVTPDRADAVLGRGEARFGGRAALAALALVLVAVPFALLLLMVEAEWGPLLRFDDAATERLHEVALEQPVYVRFMKLVSFVGSWPVYAVAFTAVWAWLLRRRLHRLAMFVLVTMPLSWLINGLTKELVDRARPALPDPVLTLHTMSFPSGHAQSAVVAYSVLLLVFIPALSRRARVAAVGLSLGMVLVIGFSRVALGVHYVSDVLAGYVLGGAWVATTTALFSAWRREEGGAAVDLDEGLEPEHAAELRGD